MAHFPNTFHSSLFISFWELLLQLILVLSSLKGFGLLCLHPQPWVISSFCLQQLPALTPWLLTGIQLLTANPIEGLDTIQAKHAQNFTICTCNSVPGHVCCLGEWSYHSFSSLKQNLSVLLLCSCSLPHTSILPPSMTISTS